MRNVLLCLCAFMTLMFMVLVDQVDAGRLIHRSTEQTTSACANGACSAVTIKKDVEKIWPFDIIKPAKPVTPPSETVVVPAVPTPEACAPAACGCESAESGRRSLIKGSLKVVGKTAILATAPVRLIFHRRR